MLPEESMKRSEDQHAADNTVGDSAVDASIRPTVADGGASHDDEEVALTFVPGRMDEAQRAREYKTEMASSAIEQVPQPISFIVAIISGASMNAGPESSTPRRLPPRSDERTTGHGDRGKDSPPPRTQPYAAA
eukprot:9192134-Pyramimonas_sp.AAC.1